MSESQGRRRIRWLVVGGVIVVLVAWGAVVAAGAWSAYHHDQRGLAELETVRNTTDPTALTASSTEAALNRASLEFAAAHGDLSGPWMVPATWLPVVGRQLRSARSLSSAAQQVSTIGSVFLGQVHDVLDQPHGAGPQRVQSLRRLSVLSLAAAHQLSAIDTGPDQALVAPLARKHDQFVQQLDDARTRLVKAAGVSAVTATILQGPQTYLVLAGNNAEMRAGSGAYLEVGTASTSDGSVHLGDLAQSGSLALAPGQVVVSGDLQRNWGWLEPGVDWRNLGLTPQFDVTADLASRMWAARTGQQVDGVLAIDIAGLRQIMTATGPVQVGSLTLDAGNVEQYLMHDQYAGLTDNSIGDAAREDALGAIASAVLSQLQGQSTDLRNLASAVSGAVAGRHLMVWSSNPKDQAAWVAAGASGSLTPTSLAVTVVNQGGNKLDQFLGVSVHVATRPDATGTAVTLTTTLANRTPDGQSQFIAGPFPGLPLVYGDYSGVVATNVPGAARDITMTGARVAVGQRCRGSDLAGGRADRRSTRGDGHGGRPVPPADGARHHDGDAVGPGATRAVDRTVTGRSPTTGPRPSRGDRPGPLPVLQPRQMPVATAPAGTSPSTTALAPIHAPSPTLTGPSTFAPAPIRTLSPMLGWPSPVPVCPRVTPW